MGMIVRSVFCFLCTVVFLLCLLDLCEWRVRHFVELCSVSSLVRTFFCFVLCASLFLSIAGDHSSKYGQILLVKIGNYIGFCVYRRSY